jgi:DNA-binding MarR family transcriptional regulator
MSEDCIEEKSRRETAIVLQNFIEQLIDEQSIKKNRSNKATKISAARFQVLQFLVAEGPKTLKQLTDNRRVTAATMSRLVSYLVKDGYVLVANSKKDKRCKIFIVTTPGRAIASEHFSAQLNNMIKSIEKLSDEEHIMLNKSIQLIKNVINLSSSNSDGYSNNVEGESNY